MTVEDTVRTVVDVAHENGGVRVVRVTVRLGVGSQLTPQRFAEEFAAAARGTPAEGAAVEVVGGEDPQAVGIVVQSVEVEPFETLDLW